MRFAQAVERAARRPYLFSMRKTDGLAQIITAWATEVGAGAAELASREARATYLAQRRAELTALARQQGMNEAAAALLVDAATNGAQRIMKALLARGASASRGRA
jgi:hypothetical protein